MPYIKSVLLFRFTCRFAWVIFNKTERNIEFPCFSISLTATLAACLASSEFKSTFSHPPGNVDDKLIKTNRVKITTAFLAILSVMSV